MNIERLTGLLAFSRAASLGSYTAAARSLSLSPSAISKSIRRLERHLGLSLFTRTTRSLTLTPEGRDLHEQAMVLFEQIEHIEQTALAARGEVSGTIKVTAPPPIGVNIICPELPSLRARYPNLVIDLRLSDKKVDLIDDGVDVALRVGELDDSRLLARRLAPNRLCAFASPKYLERRGVPLHPHELANHDCVNFRFHNSGQNARWPFSIDGRDVEITPSAGVVVDEGNAVMAVLAGGGGICVAPPYVAAPYVARGELVPLLQRFAVQRSYVTALWPESRRGNPNVTAFLAFLTEIFARLSP